MKNSGFSAKGIFARTGLEANGRFTSGKNGRDGFSPVIEMAGIPGGYRLSITDAGGVRSIDIMNGAGDMTKAVYDPAGGEKQVAFKEALDSHAGNGGIHVTEEEKAEWSGKSSFSGNYGDLSGRPEKLSDFTDDLGTSPAHSHSQYLTQHQSLDGKQDKLTGTAGQIVGFSAAGEAEAQDMPEAGLTGAQYSGTLLSSGWTESGGYKVQTIAIQGLRASYGVSPDVDCVLTGTDADGDAQVLTAWALVSICETGAGSLTARCLGDAPEANIPVTVRCFE